MYKKLIVYFYIKEEDNHFTREDVFSALEMYNNNNYITFPIDSITLLTAVPILEE
jgi:hypothetical protein